MEAEGWPRANSWDSSLELRMEKGGRGLRGPRRGVLACGQGVRMHK